MFDVEDGEDDGDVGDAVAVCPSFDDGDEQDDAVDDTRR